MDTQERVELADAAHDDTVDTTLGLEQFVQSLQSRVADRLRSERAVFEQRASSLREAKRLGQNRWESLGREIQRLQQERQELERENAARDSKLKELEIEYNAAVEMLRGALLASAAATEQPLRDPTPDSHDIDGLEQSAVAQQPSAAEPDAQSETEPPISTGDGLSQRRSKRRHIRSRRFDDSPSPEPADARLLTSPERASAATSQREVDDAEKRDFIEWDPSHQRSVLRPRKRARKGYKTVDFDEVFQDGNAEYKHTIFEYPKGRGEWYILRCDQHGVHFGAKPLQGAMKHLNGRDHGQQPKSYDIAVQMLGILVLNCDAEKADRNNLVFDRAWADGYRPLRARSSRTSGTFDKAPAGTGHDTQSSASTATPSRQGRSKGFEGVIEPAVGEVYRVWYEPDRAYYAALMLPTGDFGPVGMAGAIVETGLASYVPTCYRFDKQNKEILGWADGYEAGGPRVHRRRFPMMYFDDKLDIPLHGDLGIPEGDRFSWVLAKDLKPFDLQDQECRKVRGFRAAQAFYQRQRARTARQHDADVASNEGPRNSGPLFN
ncbi:hypothetical protein MFIFM68171_00847 [Madurella fahalii]|uniref:Uncharacterized protein n=1 Tax=Madurella fahalii TaxID=1157608 RepID=A0ABQ0FYQ7_9PEZI